MNSDRRRRRGHMLRRAAAGALVVLALATLASLGYLVALDGWLFLTVLFANFAEALAEARGKAQADALRKTRQETPSRRLKVVDTSRVPPGTLASWLNDPGAFLEEVPSTQLKSGDLVNYRISDPRIMGYLRNNSVFAFGQAERARTSATFREILDAMWLFNAKFEKAIAKFDEIKAGQKG